MSARANRKADAAATDDLLTAFAAPNAFNYMGARAALSGLEASMAALQAWRHMFDAGRDMIRAQQDATINALRSQLSANASQPNGDAADAAPFTAPMLAVAKAYEQVGDAMLHAQRTALSSFAPATTH